MNDGDESTIDFEGEALQWAKAQVLAAPSAAVPLDSQTLGEYRLIRPIGAGGMGVVYLAVHPVHALVAVKTLPGEVGPEAGSRRRFELEAETVRQLKHPNIVQLHDVDTAGPKPYFSMEYCAGKDLKSKMGVPHDPRDAASLVEVLARAMAHAHQAGIIHRDLKPGNILFTRADATVADGNAVKISDFGLAKNLNAELSHTSTGAILGTLAYAAPEQVRGEKDVQGAADIYSLGVVLYELLTGTTPFHGNHLELIKQIGHDDPLPPSRRVPTVPTDLELICLRCLQKRPSDRYWSADELADDLRRFLCGERVRARPTFIERCRRGLLGSKLEGKYDRWPLMMAVTAVAGLVFNLVDWRAKAVSGHDVIVAVTITSFLLRAVVFGWAFWISRKDDEARQIFYILAGNTVACTLLTVTVNQRLGGALNIEAWKQGFSIPLACIANAYCLFILACPPYRIKWLWAMIPMFLLLAAVTVRFPESAQAIFGVGWFIGFAGGALYLHLRKIGRV